MKAELIRDLSKAGLPFLFSSCMLSCSGIEIIQAPITSDRIDEKSTIIENPIPPLKGQEEYFPTPTPQIPIMVDSESRLRPVFRAATLSFRSQELNFFKIFGTGFLVERDGRYEVFTVLHVVDKFEGKVGIYIADGNYKIMDIDPKNSKNFKEKVDNDAIVSFNIDARAKSILDDAKNRGHITPLKLSPLDPAYGEILVSPNTELDIFDQMNFRGFRNGLQRLDLIKGYICQGRSGSPILRVFDGKITNEVVGVLTQAESRDLKDPSFRGRICSFNGLSFPIN